MKPMAVSTQATQTHRRQGCTRRHRQTDADAAAHRNRHKSHITSQAYTPLGRLPDKDANWSAPVRALSVNIGAGAADVCALSANVEGESGQIGALFGNVASLLINVGGLSGNKDARAENFFALSANSGGLFGQCFTLSDIILFSPAIFSLVRQCFGLLANVGG
jgi:hypothetical protein